VELSDQAVIAASNSWIWVPDNATATETDEYLIVRFPDYFDHPLEVVRFTPVGSVADTVEMVLDRAREYGLPKLWWMVRLDSPSGVPELLEAQGATLDETLDVLARDLSGGAPELLPPAGPQFTGRATGREYRCYLCPEPGRPAHARRAARRHCPAIPQRRPRAVGWGRHRPAASPRRCPRHTAGLSAIAANPLVFSGNPRYDHVAILTHRTTFGDGLDQSRLIVVPPGLLAVVQGRAETVTQLPLSQICCTQPLPRIRPRDSWNRRNSLT
jgi:hypothetical protein